MFRLYSSLKQYAQMAQIAGACRFVYNLALRMGAQGRRRGPMSATCPHGLPV